VNTFRQHIAEISGLRFIYENLNIKSSIGRKQLLNSKLFIDKKDLETTFSCLSKAVDYVKRNNDTANYKKLCHHLSDINDISASIQNLKDGNILDDIALFEIKKFAIISEKLKDIFEKSGFAQVIIFDLEEVISILDPENSGIPTFYIYSSYSKELAQLRKNIETETNQEKNDKIRVKCYELEDKIRIDLSKRLVNSALKISHNLEQFAHVDNMLAKAELSITQNFSCPEITEKTEYKAVFNPEISKILEAEGKSFQPIDISITNEPFLITGANMSGKTVLLKTMALCQYLFQFGFYIPAKSAKICIVDKIMLSIGENQNEMNGLSSFAVEMLNINKIISEAKSGKRILALVDELARTTNPDEGKAFVSAFVQMMTKLNVSSLITTHYSGMNSDCKRLRVKGLRKIKNTDEVTVKNINDFMDYSLEIVNDDNVPNEAIRIAEILDIDEDFIKLTKASVKKKFE